MELNKEISIHAGNPFRRQLGASAGCTLEKIMIIYALPSVACVFNISDNINIVWIHISALSLTSLVTFGQLLNYSLISKTGLVIILT